MTPKALEKNRKLLASLERQYVESDYKDDSFSREAREFLRREIMDLKRLIKHEEQMMKIQQRESSGAQQDEHNTIQGVM